MRKFLLCMLAIHFFWGLELLALERAIKTLTPFSRTPLKNPTLSQLVNGLNKVDQRSLIGAAKVDLSRRSSIIKSIVNRYNSESTYVYIPTVVVGCGPNSIQTLASYYSVRQNEPIDILVIDSGDEACSNLQNNFIRANSSSRPQILSANLKDRNFFENVSVNTNQLVNVQYPYLSYIADAATLSLASMPYPLLLGATVQSIKGSAFDCLLIKFEINKKVYEIFTNNVVYSPGLGKPSYGNLPPQIKAIAERELKNYKVSGILPTVYHADSFFKVANQEILRKKDITDSLRITAIVGAGDSAKSIIEAIYDVNSGSGRDNRLTYANSSELPTVYWISPEQISCESIKAGRPRYLGLANLIAEPGKDRPVIPFNNVRVKDIKFIGTYNEYAINILLSDGRELRVDQVVFATGYERDYTPLGLDREDVEKRLLKDRGYYGNTYIKPSNDGPGRIYFNGSGAPVDDSNEQAVALYNLAPKASLLGLELAKFDNDTKKPTSFPFYYNKFIEDYESLINDYPDTQDALQIDYLSTQINQLTISNNANEVISARKDIRANLPTFLQIFFEELFSKMPTFNTGEVIISTNSDKKLVLTINYNDLKKDNKKSIISTMKKALKATPGLVSAIFDELTPYDRIEIKKFLSNKEPVVSISWQRTAQTPKFDEKFDKSVLGKFVSIPGGTYQIGSPATESGNGFNEMLHSIALSPFLIMEAALTQEAYVRVMGKNPSQFKEPGYCEESFQEIEVDGIKIPVCADHPVENVNFDDAQDFIKRMNEIDPGHTYSLPTEAQLEIAFRGNTNNAYVSGRNDAEGLGEYVWYRDNSNNQTQAVASKLANSYGIYRSSVWEWAADWYDPKYSGSIGLDPQGPPTGSYYRVHRGGGWQTDAKSCRSARRSGFNQDARNNELGFRLVRK